MFDPDSDLAWRIRRARERLSEGIQMAKFFTTGIPVIPLVLVLSVLHVADKAFMRAEHDRQMQQATVVTYIGGVSEAVQFASLGRGHYRVASAVDESAVLVYLLVPGGGRDIPMLLSDPDKRYREVDSYFHI